VAEPSRGAARDVLGQIAVALDLGQDAQQREQRLARLERQSGVLEQLINDYKFNGRRGWAIIFGRILVGFLDAHSDVFGSVDLIVASPTYLGDGAHRSWAHVVAILEAADKEQGWFPGWPFDVAQPPAIIKTAETPPMVGLKYRQRRDNAEGPLRSAFKVPDPARTRGKTLAVFDDVFTGGLTMREVARALQLHGEATRVVGVTLARQPFPSR